MKKLSGIVIGKLSYLDKGNALPVFLTHITTEKYIYHMPIDRQHKKFKLIVTTQKTNIGLFT